MGTYLSVPFMAKKTVACEPATKQDSTVEEIKAEVKTEVKAEMNAEIKEVVQEPVEKLAPIQEDVPVVEEKKDTAPVEEEKTEEKKEEEKKADQTLKECMEIEAMMAKVSVADLKIKIPEEEVVENVVVARAPEFRNQSQPESHAVKKFNKKHRKN